MKPEKYFLEEEWRFSSVAIVKYKPQYYNEKGVYCKDEWTERGEIGSVFNGQIFTIEEYMAVEQKYVDAALKIMDLSNCKYLTLAYEAYTLKGARQSIIEMMTGRFKEYDKEYCDFLASIYLGQRLNKEQVAKLVRLNLRILAETSLTNESRHLEFHFGGDSYMYCRTRLPKEVLRTELEPLGMYVIG